MTPAGDQVAEQATVRCLHVPKQGYPARRPDVSSCSITSSACGQTLGQADSCAPQLEDSLVLCGVPSAAHAGANRLSKLSMFAWRLADLTMVMCSVAVVTDIQPEGVQAKA